MLIVVTYATFLCYAMCFIVSRQGTGVTMAMRKLHIFVTIDFNPVQDVALHSCCIITPLWAHAAIVKNLYTPSQDKSSFAAMDVCFKCMNSEWAAHSLQKHRFVCDSENLLRTKSICRTSMNKWRSRILLLPCSRKQLHIHLIATYMPIHDANCVVRSDVSSIVLVFGIMD